MDVDPSSRDNHSGPGKPFVSVSGYISIRAGSVSWMKCEQKEEINQFYLTFFKERLQAIQAIEAQNKPFTEITKRKNPQSNDSKRKAAQEIQDNSE